MNHVMEDYYRFVKENVKFLHTEKKGETTEYFRKHRLLNNDNFNILNTSE